MRKIIALEHITLDGVIQGPGGPEEDTSGGFNLGGWTAPFGDEDSRKFMQKQLQPIDILLGRKTFDIFESYWSEHADFWPGINDVTKYVISNTREKSNWNNSVFLNNLTDIQKLKDTEGTDIKIWGSSQLVQQLIQNDLVNELWLIIYPVILGKGKKLFKDGINPAAFTLTESTVTSKGVIITNYTRFGEVITGNAGAIL